MYSVLIPTPSFTARYFIFIQIMYLARKIFCTLANHHNTVFCVSRHVDKNYFYNAGFFIFFNTMNIHNICLNILKENIHSFNFNRPSKTLKIRRTVKNATTQIKKSKKKWEATILVLVVFKLRK